MSMPLLLDKSAFQALSHSELVLASRYFVQNVPAVLVHEVMADLRKEHARVVPEDAVATLAQKFLGSGGPISMSYRDLLRSNLFGGQVPMTGRIIPDNGRTVATAEGPVGFVDMSALNRVILRLADKDFERRDHEFATWWRHGIATLGFSKLHDHLRRHQVLVPRATSPVELAKVIDATLREPTLQRAWVDWFVIGLRLLPYEARSVYDRWDSEQVTFAEFAPYAHFCMRALLLLAYAVHFKLVKKYEASFLIDLQYVFYAPFCGLFVSGDRVHRLLGPLVIRDDQRFLSTENFKGGIREIIALFAAEGDGARSALSGRPPQLAGNVVTKLSRPS